MYSKLVLVVDKLNLSQQTSLLPLITEISTNQNVKIAGNF